jgi:hypothetical protein
MSLRIDTTELIPGSVVIGNTGLGVLGQTILDTTGVGTSGPGYLYNDVLVGDETKEIYGLITSQPSAGALFAYEDGSFQFTGAPDGIYTFGYTVYKDGISAGSSTATMNVGTVSSIAVSANT